MDAHSVAIDLAPEAAGEAARRSPTAEVLRDIARGGLAGLAVGVVLAGIGGRLVMRLAALLVPAADGLTTENGNRIGQITLDGTLALILFIGLFFGAVAGSLWVVISPWLPSAPWSRAVVSIPVAIALGTNGLVDDANGDFLLLHNDPRVIASLVVLVGAFGPALVVVDRWLDDRLPHPSTGRVALGAYVLVAVIGTFLTVMLVAPLYLGSDLTIAGVGLVVVGLATAGTWWLRLRREPIPRVLALVAQIALVVVVAAGLVVAAREVAGASAIG